MKALPIAFALSLLLISTVEAAKPVYVCDTMTDEDVEYRYYACAFEIEGSQVNIEFHAPMHGGPTVSLQGNYTAYAGTQGMIKPCVIGPQRVWLRSWGARYKIWNQCGEDKYLLIELAVPR